MVQFSAKTSLYLPSDISRKSVAVLASGGVESVILISRLLDHFETVYPIYVRFGLTWEYFEEQSLRRFLAAIRGPRLGRLQTLDQPVSDVYGAHWSLSGESVPDENTAEESVYLPGRNLLLVSKASIWCAIHGIGSIAMGHLKTNPFADSSPEFFAALEMVTQIGLQEKISVIRPFGQLTKSEVIAIGRDLPLEFSFSCISPVEAGDFGAIHCGRCNKCAERRRGFAECGISDRTKYADSQRVLVSAR